MTYAPYPAGLPRRLAAAVYDLFLLTGLWFIAILVLLPFTGGKALVGSNPLFQLYLLYVPYLFFGWFWTHGGQTLGMRAWHMQLRRPDGGTLGWGRALLRYIGAWIAWLTLIGILWSLLDARRRSWQDMLSGTEIVVLPKDSQGVGR